MRARYSGRGTQACGQGGQAWSGQAGQAPCGQAMSAQSGQATLEYVFTLLTAIGVFMVLSNVFLKPLGTKFYNYLTNRLNQVLTQGDLHTLPFKAPAN